jgi:predicted Rossmann-fold nucleotide-binding protein
LIQTGKIHNFPVILYGSEYWGGLIDWLRNTMLAQGKIGKADLDLMVISDSPQEIRDLVMEAMIEGGWCEEKESAARAETRRVYSPD